MYRTFALFCKSKEFYLQQRRAREVVSTILVNTSIIMLMYRAISLNRLIVAMYQTFLWATTSKNFVSVLKYSNSYSNLLLLTATQNFQISVNYFSSDLFINKMPIEQIQIQIYITYPERSSITTAVNYKFTVKIVNTVHQDTIKMNWIITSGATTTTP